MAARQAPPSLGFSRQEHWSGLPFPFPMRKSESEVAQSCLTLSNPMDCSPPGSSIHGIFQARVLEWVTSAFSGKITVESIKQWELTQRKPLEYKTQHHPNRSTTQCRIPHLTTHKTKIQTQSSTDRIATSLSLAHQRKNRQTNKNSAQISPYQSIQKPLDWH